MDEGYSPAYGARPLKRAIMRLLEDPLAEEFLKGSFQEGDAVQADWDDTTKQVRVNVEDVVTV